MTTSKPFATKQLRGGVAMFGELDAHTAPQALAAIADFGDTIAVIDLSAVTFIDSTGLRVLITARKQHPHVRVVGATPLVNRVIEISGLDYLRADHNEPAADAP